jgi:hypothetical protein
MEFFSRRKNQDFTASAASAMDFTEGFYPSSEMEKNGAGKARRNNQRTGQPRRVLQEGWAAPKARRFRNGSSQVHYRQGSGELWVHAKARISTVLEAATAGSARLSIAEQRYDLDQLFLSTNRISRLEKLWLMMP